MSHDKFGKWVLSLCTRDKVQCECYICGLSFEAYVQGCLESMIQGKN
jgi:hypothetical protein